MCTLLTSHNDSSCAPVSQEGEFPRVEASSREDAQRLWRQRQQDTMRQQKQEMKEDEKWLEMEERLLVRSAASFTLVERLAVPARASASRLAVALAAAVSGPVSGRRGGARIELTVPVVTLPNAGSTSVLCNMNLPVLLQDPIRPEGPGGAAVSVQSVGQIH